jgi:hypothetical protein
MTEGRSGHDTANAAESFDDQVGVHAGKLEFAREAVDLEKGGRGATIKEVASEGGSASRDSSVSEKSATACRWARCELAGNTWATGPIGGRALLGSDGYQELYARIIGLHSHLEFGGIQRGTSGAMISTDPPKSKP